MTKFVRTPAAAAAKPAPRTKAKPAATEAETITPVEPIDNAAEDQTIHSAYQQVRDAFDTMWSKLRRPSWMRQLINVTIGLVTYASVWYGAMCLLDMLMAGVVMYTGVGFIAFLVAFLGVLASLMAAVKVGKLAYDLASEFDYARVKSRVVGWFTFERKPSAA